MTTYREVYEGWKADPEGFWMKAAEAIDWVKAPTRATISIAVSDWMKIV